MRTQRLLTCLVRAAVPAILLLLPAAAHFAQSGPSSDDGYISRRLTTRSGLPQNTAYAFAQDRRGYMWIGTDEGVVRWDGVDFRHYHTLNTPGIKNNSITALCVAHDDRLWLGTFGGGVSIYDPADKSFTSYTTRNGLPNDFIWTITGDRKGNLWLGTVGGGIIRFKNNRFDTFTTADGLCHDIVNALCEDHRGRLWIGTENGLNRLEGSSLVTYDTRSILPDQNVQSVYQDSLRVLWIGTTGGLTAVRGRSAVTYTTRDGLSGNLIRAIHEDRRGNLWTATDGGLNLIHRLSRHEVRIEPFNTGEESSADSLMTLYRDREDNLWVGSSGQGVTILHPRRLRTIDAADGLAHSHIRAIHQDPSGAVWIGTNGGGLNRMENGRIDTFTTADGLSSNFIDAILTDADGNTWIGTTKGISRWDGGGFTNYTLEHGLSSESIRALHIDHGGTLWVGAYGGGLHRYDPAENTFRPFTGGDKLTDQFILCINEDKNQNLWIGANRGLNRVKDNTVTQYTRKNGLSAQTIHALYTDSEGTLWIGANGGGLHRFKDNVITPITPDSGFLPRVVYSLLEDREKKLWISSNKGIFTVSTAQLNQAAEGGLSRLNSKYFGEADGMASAVCTGGFQSSGARTRDGRIWFPTIKGIAVIDPASIVTNTVEPPVVIQRLTADGRSYPLSDNLELPHGAGAVKISFTALSFTAPQHVRFRYRLKGYEKQWTETSSREQAVYEQLPSGKYTFEITACNNNGAWNNELTITQFSITLPFYQTFWFYFLAASALGMLGFRIFRLPERRKQQKEEEEKYQASSLTVPRLRSHSRKLLEVIETEKPYLDPGLNAAALAQTLGVSKKHLSQVINQEFHLNFKNFINKYRVEEAKKKLLDPKEQDFVLLKIALDVGFNSKSVFNEAFKKFTGMSPSQYRKENM